jgi:predicted regulator of Ras-like GTPase activity (Roadblock/LC7/MglB family)
MMNNKLRNQSEHVQRELKALADRIPEILSVALIRIDGLKLGFYSKISPVRSIENKEEDRLGPLGAMILSLSERSTNELGGGEWEFSVIVGKQAKIFQLAVNPEIDEETVLIAITEHESLIDAILPELKATRERLIQL